MRSSPLRIAVIILVSLSFANDSVAEDGFVSIFDGSTLDGWKASTPKAAQDWTADKGMIIGRGSGRSYLIYDRNQDLSDFELKFSYRFLGEGNSGVNIRACVDTTGKRDYQAYHADIGHVGIGQQILGAWDFHTPGRTEHRCFRGERLVIDENDEPTLSKIIGAVGRDEIRKQDWNEVHVIANDNHFEFRINGKLASEFREELPGDRRLRSGMIQLQIHDPGMTVQFKDLRLKVEVPDRD